MFAYLRSSRAASSLKLRKKEKEERKSLYQFFPQQLAIHCWDVFEKYKQPEDGATSIKIKNIIYIFKIRTFLFWIKLMLAHDRTN